jgi:uncharacterized protein (TIGR00369 family)
MSIWTRPVDLDELNALTRNTLAEHLGIRFTEFGPDFLRATMPVDARTQQPFGLLHGGASVVLAETIGSVAGHWALKKGGKNIVGLEVNANHVRSVRSGLVTGTARPVHIGSASHVWDIRIDDDEGEARLHLAAHARGARARAVQEMKAPGAQAAASCGAACRVTPLLLVALLAALVACGQKGSLYLPQKGKPVRRSRQRPRRHLQRRRARPLRSFHAAAGDARTGTDSADDAATAGRTSSGAAAAGRPGLVSAFFDYRGDELHAEQVSLTSIADQHGTPCYVYSRAELRSAFNAFDKALGARPHLVCFAVKANGNLAVLHELAASGGLRHRLRGRARARPARGGAPARIVYSGAGKTAEEMRAALAAGIACFNVESLEELELLDATAGALGVRARSPYA